MTGTTHEVRPASHLPPDVAANVESYVSEARQAVGDQLEGVYAVGSAALGHFQSGASNIDLVVVGAEPWTQEQLDKLTHMHRRLNHHHRPAAVCYAAGSDFTGAVTYRGQSSEPADGLANPLTAAILARNPVALYGPEIAAPAVDNPAAVRDFSARQFADARKRHPSRLLLTRWAVSPLVMDAARDAAGVISAKPWAKDDAAEAVADRLGVHFHKILYDSLAFRQGGHTSLYWGPMERRRHALDLLKELGAAVHAAVSQQ